MSLIKIVSEKSLFLFSKPLPIKKVYCSCRQSHDCKQERRLFLQILVGIVGLLWTFGGVMQQGIQADPGGRQGDHAPPVACKKVIKNGCQMRWLVFHISWPPSTKFLGPLLCLLSFAKQRCTNMHVSLLVNDVQRFTFGATPTIFCCVRSASIYVYGLV